MNTQETALINECLKYLAIHRIEAWPHYSEVFRVDPGDDSTVYSRSGRPGASNIMGILPSGRFLAVQCKAPGEKLTVRQVDFKNDIERNKGIYIVAHELADLEAGLKGVKA